MIATIIFLCLLSGGFFINLAKHGEPKGNFHMGHAFFAMVINLILLYYMGAFNNFK